MTTDKIILYLNKVADEKLNKFLNAKLPLYSGYISKEGLDQLRKNEYDYIPAILDIIREDLFNSMKEKYRTEELSNFLRDYKGIVEAIKTINKEQETNEDL